MKVEKPFDTQALLHWWKTLEDDKAGRAELRRCRDATDVALTAAFFRFLQKFGINDRRHIDRYALIAGVLAHVKRYDETRHVAAQMATPKTGSRARVSGLRFRRLIQLRDRGAILQPMIRTVRLLEGTVDIQSLAEGLYWWSDHTRKEWAHHYYMTAPQES